MNPVRAFSLAFLFGAMAFPQSSGKQFSSNVVRASCPIELTATLEGTGKSVPITPTTNQQTTPDRQQLEITLSNPSSAIVGAHLNSFRQYPCANSPFVE